MYGRDGPTPSCQSWYWYLSCQGWYWYCQHIFFSTYMQPIHFLIRDLPLSIKSETKETVMANRSNQKDSVAIVLNLILSRSEDHKQKNKKIILWRSFELLPKAKRRKSCGIKCHKWIWMTWIKICTLTVTNENKVGDGYFTLTLASVTNFASVLTYFDKIIWGWLW